MNEKIKTNTVDLANLPHEKKSELFTRTIYGTLEGQDYDYLEVRYDVDGWWNDAPIYLRLDRDYNHKTGEYSDLLWEVKTSSGGTVSGLPALNRIKILMAILKDMDELIESLDYS